MSAFMLFSSAKRAEVKEQNPDLKVSESSLFSPLIFSPLILVTCVACAGYIFSCRDDVCVLGLGMDGMRVCGS